MSIFQSIILGIVQGLTEFLPISSSGHLVLVPYLLGWDIPEADAFIFDVLVQVATLAAVFAYFWEDLLTIASQMIQGLLKKEPFREPYARLGWLLLLSTLPAGVLGFLMKDMVEQAFASPRATAFFLFGTAILLLIAERAGKRSLELEEIRWQDALWIGFFQFLAVFPGVSRSGATIAGGMTRNLKRPAAARFAFLMSIPIMLAAGLMATVDLIQLGNTLSNSGGSFAQLLLVFTPGFISAAVVGYLSIRWLIGYLKHHPLYIFAIYCTFLGLLILVVSLFH